MVRITTTHEQPLSYTLIYDLRLTNYTYKDIGVFSKS